KATARTTRIARTTRTVTTRPRRTRSTARKPWAPERVRSAVPASGWPSVALRAQSSVARSARPAARWPAKRPKVTTRPARRRAAFELVRELVRRGHRVTTFASGDSDVPGDLVATIPRALRPAGHGGDISGYMITTMLQVLDREAEFDLIHSHLEWYSVILQRV